MVIVLLIAWLLLLIICNTHCAGGNWLTFIRISPVAFDLMVFIPFPFISRSCETLAVWAAPSNHLVLYWPCHSGSESLEEGVQKPERPLHLSRVRHDNRQ